MVLPRGITGFNAPERILRPDVRTFVADCWDAVARRGKVEDRPQVLFPPNEPYYSFITRVLILPKGEVTALLNLSHPWVGFCRPLSPGECRLEFLDPGRVAEALAETGRYRVLEKWELDQTVTEDMCGELGPAERSQLKYWRSMNEPGTMRVGDLVFNFWD